MQPGTPETPSRPLQTAKIGEALQEFAAAHRLPPEHCDFTLHGVYTYIKNCRMESYTKFDDRLRAQYSDSERLINDRVTFRQLYKITPHPQQQEELGLVYTLEFDPYRSRPLLRLSPASQIPHGSHKPQELFLLLFRALNKIKAKERILIGLFSDAMTEGLKELIKRLYTDRFTSDFSIPLFSGIEPELARPSRLELLFENKNSNHRLKEVESGELIVLYTKPVFGRCGLDAYGRVIDRGSARNEPFLNCRIDESSISVVEDDATLKLYSRKRGYVHYTPDAIEIANRLTLEQVKRVHSQIAKAELNEVEVLITQNDITEDSVGEGVHLTSEKIHISGHVADKAKVEAKRLIVDGTTHNGARLFANDAQINLHKGVLRCHRGEIKLLEGGEIHGSSVHVENALGGIIYAENVTINTVRHHLKVYATESITINSVTGEDNLFAIDYRKVPIVQSRFEYIEEDIDELRYYLREARRHREKDVPKINKRIMALREQMEAIKNSSLKASVTIRQSVRGLNTITFALPGGEEITYRTRSGVTYDPFFLETENGTVTLQPVGITR